MKKQPVTTIALVAASIIFGVVVAGGLNLTLPGRAETGGERPLHAAAQAQMAAANAPVATIPASFADIAERVNPAVVSITSTEIVQPRDRGRRMPFHGDPFEFFFGPGGPGRPNPREPDEPTPEQSGGSGFLISDDGYILTNYHVVEDASKIRVGLSGDRREYDADIVGSDPSTDLALIKIQTDKKLPTLRLGDSDVIKVGDWVVAVGNPLNYDHTVTVGVISAKGRVLREVSRDFSLDNFIQTDAAINFGNSGGPLVNLSGDVVGVNTAISSVGQGIGFAVPINVAKEIMGQLRTAGRVARGYLGIDLGEITPDMQEAFGLENDRGALVQTVRPGLPGEKAGVKRGDVIVAVDGKPVASSDEVVRIVSAKNPGSTVKLTLNRAGEQVTVTATLADRGEHLASARAPQEREEPGDDPREKALGMIVESLTPALVNRLNLPPDTRGVVVTSVSRMSEAFEKQIGEGDVIAEVNRAPVTSVSEYRREIRKVKEGGLVVFYVISPPGRTAGGDAISRYVTVRLREE